MQVNEVSLKINEPITASKISLDFFIKNTETWIWRPELNKRSREKVACKLMFMLICVYISRSSMCNVFSFNRCSEKQKTVHIFFRLINEPIFFISQHLYTMIKFKTEFRTRHKQNIDMVKDMPWVAIIMKADLNKHTMMGNPLINVSF